MAHSTPPLPSLPTVNGILPRYSTPIETERSNYGVKGVADLASTPSSISSMLRNTTETGEIGLFSIKPPRVPVMHPRPQSRSSSASQAQYNSHRRQPQNGSRSHDRRANTSRLNSLQSHPGTTSSLGSVYQGENNVGLPGRPRHVTVDGSRTPSFSHSTNFTDSLPPSLSDTSGQQRSPYAYPTRLKRPGYRPSSPALSDFGVSDRRARFGGHDFGPGFRTASPLSGQAGTRTPLGYRSYQNSSTPSLLGNNAGHAQRSNGIYSGPGSLYPGFSGRPESRQSSHNVMPGTYTPNLREDLWRQQSPSPTPLYYDYTEAFEDVSPVHYHDVADPCRDTSKLSTPRPVSTYHELEGENVVKEPTELHGRSSNESPAEEPLTIETSTPSRPKSGNLLAQVSAILKEPDSPDNDKVETRFHTPFERLEDYTTIAIQPNGEEPEHDHAITLGGSTQGHDILTSSKLRKPSSTSLKRATHRTAVIPPGVRQIHHQVSEANISRLSRTQDHDVAQTVPQRSSSLPWRVPSFQKGHNALTARSDASTEPSPSSLRGSMMRDASLFAPIAERPISSQSQNDRFSRILSIDDSFDGLSDIPERTETSTRITSGSMPLPDLPEFIHEDLPKPPFAASVHSPSSSIYSTLTIKGAISHTPKHSLHLSIPTKTTSEVYESGLKFAERNKIDTVIQLDKLQADSGPRTPPTFGPVAPKLNQIPTAANSLTTKSSQANVATLIAKESSGASAISTPLPALLRSDPVKEQAPDVDGIKLVVPKTRTSNRASAPSTTQKLDWFEDSTKPDDRPSLQSPINYPVYKVQRRGDKALPITPRTPRPQSGSRISPWSEPPGSTLNTSGKSKSSNELGGDASKTPKFNLNVIRASRSTSTTSKATKQTTDSSHSLSESRPVQTSLFKKSLSSRKSGLNSAKRSFDFSPVQTRFKESLETSVSTAPFINLRPPSPDLHMTDVRSFFSDDSSAHKQGRGSMRKRLSQFRRGGSPGLEDGIAGRRSGSAMGKSGHSRVPSNHTADTLLRRGSLGGLRLRERMKRWLAWSGERFKGWGAKAKERRSKSRAARATSTELYEGV
ncbi:hypothetical protein MMC25_002670 [Agyrium rufum]|nr:hypothetical protein [Agyrium rufum]